jgi:tRNA dimethylallyltransferase
MFNCIVVLGPTASGKTRLACYLADHLNGEIISADSRQVYRHLNIGTGKDLNEYVVKGKQIPYHLIDVADPGEQFYLHQFMNGLKNAFELITSKNKIPIICGGTGLYLDALRKDFSFTQIKENETIRKELEHVTKEELIARLRNYPQPFTEHVDLDSKKRIIRGIEIAEHFLKNGGKPGKPGLPYKPYYLGVKTEIETRKKNISERLVKRLDEGLIAEADALLKGGISGERLELFGLEYKFVLYYLQNKIKKEQLVTQLQTAIFQFAKRQMTWFRKMEKEGVKINWVENNEDNVELLKEIKKEFQL